MTRILSVFVMHLPVLGKVNGKSVAPNVRRRRPEQSAAASGTMISTRSILWSEF